MTKAELRKARKVARENGLPLTGELSVTKELPKPKRAPRKRNASRAEQYGRYLDCGPGAWDDR